ncbi:uncharacterized protein LOC119434115 isoform X1 [Dermacentor silvarum]|uniref:uncharacterized protein LOC119434115 isoform X1 n=1 Tax=Dermacentor silvarum TaxID=543639 RepID=UPI002101CAFD|nr:uncharacterized protein LOC119434115 isoform X1 [Dermacentor silvarum]
MSSGGRGVIVRIWNNFLSSITTKQSPHREVGRDHFGNRYFEIAADPSRGKRKPRRWFEPRTKDNFNADMPPEWEAWLRARRSSPPTQEFNQRSAVRNGLGQPISVSHTRACWLESRDAARYSTVPAAVAVWWPPVKGIILRATATPSVSTLEIAHNEAIKQSKLQKAALLERTAREDRERRQTGVINPQLPTGFPTYDDYKQTDTEETRSSEELPGRIPPK